MANIIAIVGRPNVGKSTLFNRLVEKRKAIMDNFSGVTRDRHYGYGEWNGKHFSVIDTGGYVFGSEDIFEDAIRKQVVLAINEASVVLFMVDCITGMTGLDQDFANVLRSVKKPVLVVANKADSTEKMMASNEFYAMGFEQIYPISSANGSGTGELLDDVVNYFKTEDDENPHEGIPRIAILGRPNVGKSSFLNVLLGQERSIVTDIAGTTRDAIDTPYNMFGKELILTDTAGIRKKSKLKDKIEFYSVVRSIDAMENSDVCIIMIDARYGLESQDMNIISLADRYKKGMVLMVNKWDLVEKDTYTHADFEKVLKEKLGPLAYIPILFSSVLEKKRIMQALDKAAEVYKNRQKRVPTAKLNDVMLQEIQNYSPPAVRGKYIKIKYVTQLPTRTPTFAFFCNFPQHIKAPYERYLENRLREHFDFTGVPVKLVFRKK
ncbi:MAG: ribosome biogenesis GTPase Der [Candidatus Cyclobacteriaceae bacterium M3_2C_046]